MVVWAMIEPTPDETPRLDASELSFSDAPAPNHHASSDFHSDDPPATNTVGGFRGFASRSARKGRTKPKETKQDFPLVIKQIPNRKGQFVEPLTQLYAGIGTTVILFDPVCGQAILQSAPKCAESIDELAYRNEAVRRAVFALTQTSAIGAVLVAHLPIIMAVVMHHVPAAQQAFGVMGANMMEEFLKQSTAPGGKAAEE